MFKRGDRRRRLTGVGLSVTGASLSWQIEQAERGRAREALHKLEDHRMLYNPFMFEVASGVLSSVQDLRAYLGEMIPRCESVELRDGLREIRAAMRQCLTDFEVGTREARRVSDGRANTLLEDVFLAQALAAARVRTGLAVARIAQAFDLTIDGDLARILPRTLDETDSDEPPTMFDGLTI